MIQRELRLFRIALLIAFLTLASACGPSSEPRAEEPVPTPESQPSGAETAVREALAHPERPAVDRQDDASRKPAEVLAFFGIEPGMRVLDLLAGGGYYTEILARTVGPEGAVYFHNNQGYANFLGDELDLRVADNRLANVTAIRSELDELELPPASLDAVIFILGYHDTYWEPGNDSWPSVDRQRLLREIYDALVPGGILGIVDHAANPGGDTTAVVNELHRIDEAVVRSDIEAAGFALDAETDMLRNTEDAKDTEVFDESIRRRTDRFVLRYEKPA